MRDDLRGLEARFVDIEQRDLGAESSGKLRMSPKRFLANTVLPRR
jgi:hypothetical protein